MDWLTYIKKFKELIKKYRLALLVLGIGVVLMLIPSVHTQQDTPPITTVTQEQDTLQQQLAQILSTVEGAGRVQIMLSVAEGEKIVYQTNEDQSGADTVTVTDSQRNEDGLIKQVNPPKYLGAVIVCEGATRADVRLALAEAVSKITGLGMDKIAILKMQ